MNFSRKATSLRSVVLGLNGSALSLALVVALLQAQYAQAQQAPASAAPKAALTVTVVTPLQATVPATLPANGSIAAWQEALIGAEVNGLRLAQVRAEVGDRVKRGQVLAVFNADTARAELAQLEAALAEGEATLADAAATAERARSLKDSTALSAQQIQQYLTAEQTARARVAAQRASLQVQKLRLAQAVVLAPDNGLISARSATVGAVVPAGQELFRLIRGGRLEWRAEVPAADLVRLQPGQAARLTMPSGRQIEGTVRKVAPGIDAQTRNGLVYVDLTPDPDGESRAGMFARGSFTLGSRAALTLPAAAVILRDGFQVVMRVGADQRVSQVKVTLLSRDGDRVAVAGLPAEARVVASGAAFLSDGDTVRVVAAGAAPVAAPVAAAPAATASAATTAKPAGKPAQ